MPAATPELTTTLGIDHPVEHFATQSNLFVRVDDPCTEERLELLALTRVHPLKFVVTDLRIIHGGNRDAAFRSHVLVNAPQREWNADEDHDPPRDPGPSHCLE